MSHIEHKNSLRFAIVGCGKIAERHASIMLQHGQVIAVCDIIKQKADTLAQKYHSNTYSDLEEMLNVEKNIDVLAVCTPNGLHAQHSILGMEHGSNVICEKPMALSREDCLKMISVSEKRNKKIFVVKQNRYNPPVVQLKKWMDIGALGRILQVQVNGFWNRTDEYYNDSWKGTADMDGGTLFTQFSHFVDLMVWLFGDMKVESVMMENSNHKGIIEFEDSGSVHVRFNSGAIGSLNYNVNAYMKNMEGSIFVFGERGTVKIGGQYLNELEYHSVDGIDQIYLPSGNPANQYGNYTGSMSNHDKVYQNVVDVLEGNSMMDTSVFEAMKTVEIIEEMYKRRKITV